jgi:hypothetical protein
MMPHLDGYGVLEQIRRHRATQGVPFIFLAAKGERAGIFLIHISTFYKVVYEYHSEIWHVKCHNIAGTNTTNLFQRYEYPDDGLPGSHRASLPRSFRVVAGIPSIGFTHATRLGSDHWIEEIGVWRRRMAD